ncbi:hypothetical protein ANTPLA_LOCUS3521 [Anthophora plagiata]
MFPSVHHNFTHSCREHFSSCNILIRTAYHPHEEVLPKEIFLREDQRIFPMKLVYIAKDTLPLFLLHPFDTL